MKNNIKKIIAAALAAVCLSGCSVNNGGNSAPSSYSTISSGSYGSSSEETVSSEPAVSSDSSELSYPDIVNSSGFDDSAAASTQSETRYPDIVAGGTYQCDPDLSWGHTYEDVISPEPTKTQPGQVKSVCKTCGRVHDRVKYANYFNEIIYTNKENAEADLAAYNLVEELGLNKGNKSDLEKLCILKKWFCDNTKYDLAYYTGYDMLIKHEGLCMAYGEALCLLLPKCGIETIYCSDENHAWNAVKIDGQWTYTDFTGNENGGTKTVILGSSCHGLSSFISYQTFDASNGQRLRDFDFDASVISTKLRLFDLNGNELEVHEEADGFSYVDSNGKTWKKKF